MKKTTYITALGMILVFAGCGNGPTGGSSSGKIGGSVQITVKEHAGQGLPGFTVSTVPATVTATTDTAGTVRITDIAPGTYEVNIRKEGYPQASRSVVLFKEERALEFAYYPAVTLSLRTDTGRPMAGAVITTEPPTVEKTADSEGRVVFENFPDTQFRFKIKPNGSPEQVFTLDVSKEIYITVDTGKPQVSILSPLQNALIPSPLNIMFKGEGIDAEDGDLSGNSLAWYSDRNGLLGYGREITASALDTGVHTITLEGTDSDGKKSTATVPITVNEYYIDTYFPVPRGEVWQYRLLVPEFYLTTETGSTEYWVVKDVTVRIEDGPSRKVTMLYDISRGTTLAHCRYILTDYLEVQGGAIYVTKTEESIEEWESSRPYFTMDISTAYVPRHLMLKNIGDISAERTYSTKSDVTITTLYEYYGQNPRPFQEWKAILTDIEIGAEQTIQTDMGNRRAFEVTMREKGGFTRTWHIAKGIGIIRFTDNVFNPMSVAVLKDASILRFLDQNGGTAKQAASGSLRKAPTLDFRVNRQTGENMGRLAGYLGSVCPR